MDSDWLVILWCLLCLFCWLLVLLGWLMVGDGSLKLLFDCVLVDCLVWLLYFVTLVYLLVVVCFGLFLCFTFAVSFCEYDSGFDLIFVGLVVGYLFDAGGWLGLCLD